MEKLDSSFRDYYYNMGYRRGDDGQDYSEPFTRLGYHEEYLPDYVMGYRDGRGDRFGPEEGITWEYIERKL